MSTLNFRHDCPRCLAPEKPVRKLLATQALYLATLFAFACSASEGGSTYASDPRVGQVLMDGYDHPTGQVNAETAPQALRAAYEQASIYVHLPLPAKAGPCGAGGQQILTIGTDSAPSSVRFENCCTNEATAAVGCCFDGTFTEYSAAGNAYCHVPDIAYSCAPGLISNDVPLTGRIRFLECRSGGISIELPEGGTLTSAGVTADQSGRLVGSNGMFQCVHQTDLTTRCSGPNGESFTF
jgi:hypothetical protein